METIIRTFLEINIVLGMLAWAAIVLFVIGSVIHAIIRPFWR